MTNRLSPVMPPRRRLGGFLLALVVTAAALVPVLTAPAADDAIRWWASTADLAKKLAEQPPIAWQAAAPSEGARIRVNPGATFQTMLGMGSSLEPATCWNLSRMSAADRDRTLQRLVSPSDGIGMNLMRICIGTPDFTGDPWYSYNDLPPGETDPTLSRFTIEKDRAYILPVLNQAQQKNPDLLFIASPWSPPGWMKSTGSMIGGHLLPRWYPVYAEYFVKFIRAYESEGIAVHAITVQNEPGVDRAKEKNPKWFYPSCHWTAEQEREFIRDHLGPAFRRHGLTTRIWTYDHNFNATPRGDDPGIAYPRAVLSDPQAASFVGGVAFHGYVGQPTGMSVLRKEFPDVPFHFTEGSVFGVKGGVELIGILRNHASSYNAWVTILDETGRPNNGPFEASRTIVTVDSRTRTPTEHFDFFLYGHFMKFVRRGAVRVESDEGAGGLANVAFRNPDGQMALVVINSSDGERRATIEWAGRMARVTFAGQSASTLTWSGDGPR
jgi:glucosylceramidase